MKKINLGQTIQLLANIGVITGIVFLGVEIAQNTRSLEAEAFRELSNQILNFNESSMGRPGLRASEVTIESFAELSADLQGQLQTEVLNRIRYGDQVFYHYEAGMLTEERFESLMSPVTATICRPLYQQRWDILEVAFVSSYREYITSVISTC